MRGNGFVLWGILAIGASGCASFASFQEVDTLAKKESEIGVGATVSGYRWIPGSTSRRTTSSRRSTSGPGTGSPTGSKATAGSGSRSGRPSAERSSCWGTGPSRASGCRPASTWAT